MLNGYEPERKPMSANQKLWLGFAAALVLVLCYVGWIFYSRWHENHAINEEVTAERKEKDQRDAAATVESLGGSEFKIISFYASPGDIHRGDTVTMCYGVPNGKSGRIYPPSGETWPPVRRWMHTTP